MNRCCCAVILGSLLLAACSFEIDYDRYAVVYGVADYDGTANDLNYCDDDAQSMESILLKDGYKVYCEIDGNASRAALESDFQTIINQATEEDLFLFYFSGHGGFYDSGQSSEPLGSSDPDEFIVLHDLVPADCRLTDDDLSALLRQVPCNKKIVILDTCNSGGFIGQGVEVDGIPPNYEGEESSLLENLGATISLYINFSGDVFDISPYEALVISAAGELEYSYEVNYLEHGVFTYFLLDSVTYGDRNNDGYVTVLEAYDYTRLSIERNWNLYYSSDSFSPHVSGGPVDFVLFKAQ